MPKTPKSREVTLAIRTLGREVKLAIKEINQQAAKRLARGDYAGAQSMIETARAVSEFSNEVKSLSSRWRELSTAGRGSTNKKESQTPLWEFYRPILQALVVLDGKATRKQIEAELEGKFEGQLKEGDFIPNAHGVPRWKVMVARARKHMIAEGFIADEKGFKWKITKKGAQVAKEPAKT